MTSTTDLPPRSGAMSGARHRSGLAGRHRSRRAAYAQKYREKWRRRLLPAAGIVATLGSGRRSSISSRCRPSSRRRRSLVAATLYAKFGLLMSNLRRPRSRRSPASCSATSPRSSSPQFRAQEVIEEAFFPIVGDDQHDPCRRQGADPGAAARQRHGAEDRHRSADLLLPHAREHGARAGSGESAGHGVDARAFRIQDRGFLQAAAVQFATLSILGAEDCRIDFGDRRRSSASGSAPPTASAR